VKGFREKTGRRETLYQGHVYLDFTGAGLYAASHVREHGELLERHVFGNPHSASPSSSSTTHLVESARAAVLDWFNGAGDYSAVFTLNASGALKLIGESYPFGCGGRYVLTADNHNSVNGIREFARARGTAVGYAPLTSRVAHRRVETVDAPRQGRSLARQPVRFSRAVELLWCEAFAVADRGWNVLLDEPPRPQNRNARFRRRLVLQDVRLSDRRRLSPDPQFDSAVLQRPWFAGGTVNFATVQGRLHVLAPGEAGFEDGTLNYLSIPAVEIGLRRMQRIGMDAIQTRVGCLTNWLLNRLLALRHRNGRALVRIYGPASSFMPGGTVTMNFYDPDSHLLDYRRIDELAGLQGISLRTGCFCNPGAGEWAEGLTEDDMLAGISEGMDITQPRFLRIVQHRGKSAGAIRVSFGLVSNFSDVARFVEFATSFRDQTALTIGEATFDIDSCRVIRDGG